MRRRSGPETNLPFHNAEPDDPFAVERVAAHQFQRSNVRIQECTIRSIVHYLDSDEWTLELVSGDTLDGERIVDLYRSVRAALWTGERLRFRPTSALHETNIANVRDELPTVTADEVFAGIRYQPLTTGTAYGFLRLVKGTLDPATVRADQILVLEHLPDEIPVSAGVVSRELQAPLGHIAILCATRGTPNIALRDAFERADFAALDGKLVALDVDMQEFSIRAATREQAEKAWKKRRPKRPQVPASGLAPSGGWSTCRKLHLARHAIRGREGRAARRGQSHRRAEYARRFRDPAVLLPRSWLALDIPADLAKQLADPAFAEDAARRARWLESVRDSIQKRAVDPVLIKRVRERIQQIAPGSRWIFRSSTNAEDLAGFTGAGLYRSIRVKAGADDAQIAAAIAEVWASVWLQGAFEERAWYRVDHAAVGMAILVQPYVDGAVANGVAITANPFTEQRPGFFINAQSLAGSVTGAGGNEVPEQHLIYTYSGVFETGAAGAQFAHGRRHVVRRCGSSRARPMFSAGCTNIS